MNLSRRRLGQLSLAALAAACTRTTGDPELLIHGGPIYTGVAANPRVEALRISGGRIVFAGALSEARTGRVQEIDLAGATALPGLTDSHVHLTGVGMAAMLLDLVGTESIAALQARLRTYAEANPEGPIIGRGWIETHWPERRFPTRQDLDAVVADRPVLLERIDGHASVANSAALTLAGIDANTPNPDGGRIEHDRNGQPTGMLIDNAVNAVVSRMPQSTPEMRREALKQGARLYASRGWTGVHNVSTTAEEEQFFRDLAQEGEMPLRADIYLEPGVAPELMQRVLATEPSLAVRTLGVKLYMDGALGSRGAMLLAPYSDARDTSGLFVTPPDTIREQMRAARTGNYQAVTHAIGDRGNRVVLDLIRDTFADDPDALRAARWRIEHAQIIDVADIPRFSQMGVIASMQPSHAISDLHFAPARLGPNRLAGAYAWKALLDSGAVICGGSDAPVEKGDPLIEFYAAAYRHDLNGFAGPDWHLEEAVTRDQALAMFTSGAAYAVHAESDRGTLEVGKRADISAFSVDLMTAEPAAIPTAQPMLTVMDGRVTHSAL